MRQRTRRKSPQSRCLVPTWFPCRLMRQLVEKEENKLHVFAALQKESRRLGNEYNNLVSPNPENKNHFLLTPNTVLLPRKHREVPFRQVARGVQDPVGQHSAQLHVCLCTRGWLPRSRRCGSCSTMDRVSAARAVACLGGSNDRTPDG